MRGLTDQLRQGGNAALDAYQTSFDRSSRIRENDIDRQRKMEAEDFNRQRTMKSDANTEQDRKDRDMLQVFKLAGDGRVDEAKMFAQSKALEIPQQIYENSDFAKGLALSGEQYPGDPAAAQKFVMAWMESGADTDLQTRVSMAAQAAGAPVNQADRSFQNSMALASYNASMPTADQKNWEYAQGLSGDQKNEFLGMRRSANAGGMTPYQDATLNHRNRQLSARQEEARIKFAQDAVKESNRNNAATFKPPLSEQEAEMLFERSLRIWDENYQSQASQISENPLVSAYSDGAPEQQVSGGLMSPPPQQATDPQNAHAIAVQNRQAEIGQNPNQRNDLSGQQPIAPPTADDVEFAGTTMMNGVLHDVYQDRRTGQKFYEANPASR